MRRTDRRDAHHMSAENKVVASVIVATAQFCATREETAPTALHSPRTPKNQMLRFIIRGF